MAKRKKKIPSEGRAAERAETARIMRQLEERITYHKEKLAAERRSES